MYRSDMNAQTITIRRATVDDLPALRDAHLASIREIGPDFYPQEIVKVWGRDQSTERYLESVERGEIYFIAEEATQPGIVLGFSSYEFEKEKHWLKALYVRGTAAKCGLGKRLLQTVEEFTRVAGGTILHVEGSLSGERFYKNNGFVETSRHKHEMGDDVRVKVDAIMMQKPL